MQEGFLVARNPVMIKDNEVFWENRNLMKGILELLKSLDIKDQKEKDQDIDIKMFITILDQVGVMIKKDDPLYKEKGNLVAVREFIDWFISQRLYEDPEYRELMVIKEKLLKRGRS